MDDVHQRDFRRGRNHVVDEAGAQELTVFVVDQLLEQRRTDALRHATVHLAVDDHGIDDPAAVLGDDEFEDLHEARHRIDLDRGDVGRRRRGPVDRVVGVGRAQFFARLDRQRLHVGIDGLGDLLERHRAVSTEHDGLALG